MTIGYVADAAFGGVTTPEVLIKPLLSFFGEQRTLSIARMTDKSIAEPAAPTPAELRDFYTKNTARFAQPERRRISVLTYSADDFIDKVQLTPDQIKAEYDKRIKEFSSPETRDIAQYAAPDRNTIQAFVDAVKAGTTADEAMQKTAGVTRVDLTVKPADLTEKQYSDLVFALPVGQLQGPFQVQEAFYAVQVLKITPGIPTPIEQVSEQISAGLRKSDAVRLFQQSEEGFYDMAGGATLEDISKQIGAPVLVLQPVDAGAQTRDRHRNTILATHEDAMKSLFALPVGQVTDVIEGDNERSIFRVDEIVPAYTLSYEEVEGDLKKIMMAQRVQEAADKLANDMVASVKGGQAFAQAATLHRMAALPSLTINRAQQPPISQAVATGAFNLKVGDVGVVKNENGEPWVVKVDKVEPVSVEAAAAIRQQVAQNITQGVRNDVQEIFVRGVQTAAKVKPNEAAITKYFDDLTKDQAQ